MSDKTLLIVAHAPSDTTRALRGRRDRVEARWDRNDRSARIHLRCIGAGRLDSHVGLWVRRVASGGLVGLSAGDLASAHCLTFAERQLHALPAGHPGDL